VISRAILTLPRLFLGVIFSSAVYSKITAGDFPARLSGFLGQVLVDATPAYQAFARAIVLPHVEIVAALVIIGETFVAIAMLAGIATRLGALVAVLLLLNYMLAKGMALWIPASNDAADIVLAIVVGVGAAGRVWGVDAVLSKRYPHVPLW
jgi:thiosulfate dehydrogenase [quinone] large subunit